MDAIKQLKEKVIEQYNQYLVQMFVGKYPDYHYILDKIVFIDMYKELNNRCEILNYLMLH